jgi:hypothetical protein
MIVVLGGICNLSHTPENCDFFHTVDLPHAFKSPIIRMTDYGYQLGKVLPSQRERDCLQMLL